MEHYNTKKGFCPHLLVTRIHAVETYRETKDIGYVCRKYHISKASLMRWNKRYDGTKESLANKSHRPHTPYAIRAENQRCQPPVAAEKGVCTPK